MSNETYNWVATAIGLINVLVLVGALVAAIVAARYASQQSKSAQAQAESAQHQASIALASMEDDRKRQQPFLTLATEDRGSLVDLVLRNLGPSYAINVRVAVEEEPGALPADHIHPEYRVVQVSPYPTGSAIIERYIDPIEFANRRFAISWEDTSGRRHNMPGVLVGDIHAEDHFRWMFEN